VKVIAFPSLRLRRLGTVELEDEAHAFAAVFYEGILSEADDREQQKESHPCIKGNSLLQNKRF